jgi:GWxTD domain-containing protein
VKHIVTFLLSASVFVSAQAVWAQEQVAREHIEQGLAFASGGDTVLAFAELEKARDADPDLAETYYYIGRLYTERASAVETDFRDRLKAEEALLEALRLSPSEPRYLLELARLRMKQHMKIDAGRLFNRALEEAEERGDPQVLADVHFYLGYIKELWYRALEYRRFTPMHRGPPQDNVLSAGIYGSVGTDGPVRYGNEYMRAAPAIEGSGQIAKEEMIENYRAALRYDPGHVGAAIRLMGQLLDEYRLGEYLAVGRRLQAANPERPMPYLYLGLGLHVAGREEQALESFEAGLARLPDEERAEIESIAEVIRREDAELYSDLEEERRQDYEERYWSLMDPLYLTDANERRLEHMSRVAYADLRFSAPEAGLRGWETDQGIIYVRYGPPLSIASFGASPYSQGNPYAVGRRSIIWSYGQDGPVFIFRQMPGYMNARFAGDYKFIADNYRYLQPSTYDNIPSIAEMFELPVQLARFRGETTDQIALEIHAALPLEQMSRDLDLERGEFETGMFLINDRGEKVIERTGSEVLTYAESPELNENRSWRVTLPPSGTMVAAVETRDAVTWRAAAARDTFTAEPFGDDSLMISDILVADYVKPLVEEPRSRSDFEIWANAAMKFQSGDPVHIYYEIYGLDQDSEGFASYEVSIQVRVKKLKRGGGISALLGLLADAWGFSIVGDDRLELRYSRQVDMDGRDRVTEFLSLDPQEVPDGEYEIRLRIWDNIGEEMGRQLRVFEVVNEE